MGTFEGGHDVESEAGGGDGKSHKPCSLAQCGIRRREAFLTRQDPECRSRPYVLRNGMV